MNGFVEECRREWKRLGVPDPVANEMAADLTADLEEAAAEGASPEQVLGTGAHDPTSFAAAWAAERGVIPVPSMTPQRRVRLAAVVAFALLAVFGLVLVAVESRTRSARLAVAPAPARVAFFLPGRIRRPPGVVNGALPRFRFFVPARTRVVELGPTNAALWWVGLVALVVGVAGTIASALVWKGRY